MSLVPSAATDAAVITAIDTWLHRAVLGLNLCPFAHEPVRQRRLHITVSPARDADALLQDLERELLDLRSSDPLLRETTLLVHPYVLRDFDAFANFLPVADLSVRLLGLEGVLQLASFHPDYRFADTAADDVANATNRAPHPCLHLLREASISRAVANLTDPDAIYRRNIATLQRLGWAGWHDLLARPR